MAKCSARLRSRVLENNTVRAVIEIEQIGLPKPAIVGAHSRRREIIRSLPVFECQERFLVFPL
jgi:hypothetical protein